MRRFDPPILFASVFASAALLFGADAAVAHRASCDSGSCAGEQRDDGDDLRLEKERDGSALGPLSFNDDDLEDKGLGKKKKKKDKGEDFGDEDSDHKKHNGKKHNGKNRDDDVAKSDDDDDDDHFDDDDDFDHGDHHGDKDHHDDDDDGGVVPEPSLGLLLAAPLLALGLRSRKRR